MRYCPLCTWRNRVPDTSFGCKWHWNGLTLEQKNEAASALASFAARRISMDELWARWRAIADEARKAKVN